MNNLGFILFLNNNPIGIFNDEDQLNNYINGCVQNKFFHNDDIKTEKYIMNSIVCLNKETVRSIKPIAKELRLKEENKEKNNKETTIKELEKIKQEKEELEERRKKMIESEDYKKMMQEKIDTKHQLNELKHKKKKLDEEKQAYEYDLQIYEKMKIEKGKIENFQIPEIFVLKFDIFEKLENSNQLNFDVFKTEWDKVKPKNNYSLFASNPYENSFVTPNTTEDINIELDI